jgi:hypothetical protein
MTTSTIIMLNGFIAAGLLTVLALVLYASHRAAGSEDTRLNHWLGPLELRLVGGASGTERDLNRAA